MQLPGGPRLAEMDITATKAGAVGIKTNQHFVISISARVTLCRARSHKGHRHRNFTNRSPVRLKRCNSLPPPLLNLLTNCTMSCLGLDTSLLGYNRHVEIAHFLDMWHDVAPAILGFCSRIQDARALCFVGCSSRS